MKLGHARIWLALSCTAAVLALAGANLGRTQPGPLAAAHDNVTALDGGSACSQCHGGWFSDLQQACLGCHADIESQLEERRGLHGGLPAVQAKGCGQCHSEHHGADFALVNRASWAMAGVADQEAFDHARIGFELDGRHLELRCAQCHTYADEQPLADGHKRFLLLQQDCATCHDDAHGGAMLVRCDQCHGQTSFQQPASKGHERFLALAGGHAGLECQACHEPGSARDVMTLGRTALRSPRTCTDCHQSPHRQPLLLGAAPDGETAAAGALCATCHLALHATFAAADATMTPALHAASGFPLLSPHADVTCEQCHAATGTFAERYPGRDADGCASCHDDPHGGQFAQSPLAERGCLSCHDRQRFVPHVFTAGLHARTALPLSGRHADAECSACHQKQGEDTPRQFHGVGSRCDDCHRDVHDGAFAASTELAATPGGTCARCHDSASFTTADAAFDHGHFTQFALAGAHALARCEVCHPRAAAADEHGRAFGRVADQHGAFRGCVTCHEDPHRGRFDRAGLPTAVGGRRNCERCHEATSFRALSRGFDHGQWTGFPLHGAHGNVQCSACHVPTGLPGLPEAGTAGDAIPPPSGTDCADCHQEPHEGQFQVGGRTDCRRCHRAALTFADLTFRHDFDSRFKLGDAHKELACSACHRAGDTGAHAVRYRPILRECTDCHGQQQDPLRRQTRRRQEGR